MQVILVGRAGTPRPPLAGLPGGCRQPREPRIDKGQVRRDTRSGPRRKHDIVRTTEGWPSVTTNKELYRRWIDEAWTKGNVDVLDDMNTPDFVDHSGLPGVSPDTAGMKQFIVGLHAAFSDVAMTIEDMVAEGDRLVGRWVMRGTNTGSFNGMPPTGRPVTLSGFDLLRVEGDRFAEVWHVEDIAGMLQQLGVLPGPPSP